jgi:hypothetical protein
MFDNRARAIIAKLVYPIQFERKPIDGVDWVLAQVANDERIKPAEYLSAVREALQSTEELSALIPQDHSESVIRGYLAEMERRLMK